MDKVEEKDPFDWLNNPTCENSQMLGYKPALADKSGEIFIICKCCGKSQSLIISEPAKLMCDDPVLQPLMDELSESWHKNHVKSNDITLHYLGFVKTS